MDMSKMIFVTGFARGGTTWLRNCIGTHPEISRVGSELVLFRDHAGDRAAMERIIREKITEQGLTARMFVEKSPANAPHIDEAVRLLPESKFLFIIRDPRDVFISHKRGTRAWMGGVNKRVDGCMKKIQQYYEGFQRAQGAANLMLVRYEDLHQDFYAVMERIFEFVGVEASQSVLDECYEENSFWAVASRNIERRDEAERKGVVGDWVNFLEPSEAKWFKKNAYWTGFMQQYGYDWEPATYERIFQATAEAGVASMSEDDLLHARIDPSRVNLLLTHDIDNLNETFSQDSILEAARVEAQLGMAGTYYFLPLDDKRYSRMRPAQIIDFIRRLRSLNPKLAIGLHLNAAERFFPPEMDEVGDDHPDMAKAVAYLHKQVDDYERLGIHFKTSTAHGYGRRRKKPNNRNSPIFSQELAKRGIVLWDSVLRPRLRERCTEWVNLSDVGGAIAAFNLPDGPITSPQPYRELAPGTLIHLLMHPGNYDIRKPSTLGRRRNRAAAATPSLESSAISS